MSPTATQAVRRSPGSAIAFYCLLALIFLRFSFLHETITSLTGTNTYLLYVFGPPALLGVFASGGLQRVFGERPGKFWLGFLLWMAVAVPFSSWVGGSATHWFFYLKTNFPMLLVAGGLAATWKDCRKIIYAIAAAGGVNVVTTRFLMTTTAGDRLAIDSSGLIANSNDLAAHLLLVLPFLLFITLRKGTNFLLRALSVVGLLAGLYQILHTGSRGALLALFCTVAFVLFRGSRRQRMAVGVLAPVILVTLIALLPGSTWNRLTSFSESSKANGEAIESAENREYLLRQSVIYTVRHPFFGVGPGQFSSFEGSSMKAAGLRGNWHETHNSFTQASSEFGIPGLVFYLGAVFSTFGLLGKIHNAARGPSQEEIITAVFCLRIALVAFVVAIFFVNFAYHFHLLAFSGLVIAMAVAVRNEIPDRPSAPAGEPRPPSHALRPQTLRAPRPFSRHI